MIEVNRIVGDIKVALEGGFNILNDEDGDGES